MTDETPTREATLSRIAKVLPRVSEQCWDFKFLTSVAQQMEKGRTLSPGQDNCLRQIEGRHSDEAINAAEEWKASWDEEKERNFTIAARYYKTSGYYSSIVHKYFDANNKRQGIPYQKEYGKIVNNKYAAAIIANLTSEPKFHAGSWVIHNSKQLNDGKPMTIIENSDDPTKVSSYAKGARPVRVLKVGDMIPYWTEERFLKKYKHKK